MRSLTTNRTRIAWLLAAAVLMTACGGTATTTDAAITDDTATDSTATDSTATDSTATTAPTTAPTDSDVESTGTDDPAAAVLAAGWSDNVTITIDGDSWVFESDGLPSHEVLDQYLAANQDGKSIDESGVVATPTQVTIPLVPTVADAPTQTGGGTIGVAISGAAFFNPFEANSVIVANDDNETIDGVPFIDACGGHPVPGGRMYHYHGIPFCITDAIDTPGAHSQVVGYMLDGFAIYGPQGTDGEEPADLDDCLGHTGLVPGSDTAIYHYHVSSQANYISECLVGEYQAAGRP